MESQRNTVLMMTSEAPGIHSHRRNEEAKVNNEAIHRPVTTDDNKFRNKVLERLSAQSGWRCNNIDLFKRLDIVRGLYNNILAKDFIVEPG